MKNELPKELTLVKEALLNTFSLFSEDTLNIIPFEGSWTSGQVAEHILISATGVARAMSGPLAPAERDPEQHIKLLGDIFLNFDVKLNSPDFVRPSDKPKNKDTLTQNLSKTFGSIITSARDKDTDLLCTSFEMPTLGFLSVKELAYFTIVHTQRHIRQLRNIADSFAGQNIIQRK